MNRIQKISWCIVINISLAFVVSLVAVGLMYLKYGMPKALVGFCLMGLAGISGLSPLFFKEDKGAVVRDERDKLIHIRSAWGGFACSYLVMGLACMIPFFILGPQATISVVWLPNIFMAGGIAMFFAYSVAILIQYGREGATNE
jgi:hypothetical protein